MSLFFVWLGWLATPPRRCGEAHDLAAARGVYCGCCGAFVTVMSLRTWLSTEYSVNG